MKNRFLAILLALCLLTSLSAGALAEDIEISAVEVEAVEAETDSLDLPGEPEGDAPDVPEADVSDEEITQKAAVPGSLADAPDFIEGYAAILVETNLIYDDAFNTVAENLTVDTPLYVVERGTEGQALVACGVNGEIVKLWIDAASLRAMEADEVTAYIEAARQDADTLWLDENKAVVRIVNDAPADRTTAPVLNTEALSLNPGETTTLSAEGNITWSSADEAVATVDEAGLVTAVAPGKTQIVATVEGGATATCEVTVNAVAKGIHFNVTELTLGVKESSNALATIFDELNAVSTGSVIYETGNKKIATVTAAGVVKGLKKGTTTITATDSTGEKAVCQVTVVKAPSKVIVSPTTLTLSEGQSYTPSYALNSGSVGAVAWSSNRPAIASVDPQSGEVTALSGGSATITVKTYNGKKATIKLTVNKAPTTMRFSQESISMGVGQKLTALVDGEPYAYASYTVDDPSVVSDNNGILVAMAEGTTHVKAETYNGLTAECDITVKPAPPYVKLDFDEVSLGVNNSLQLQPDSNGFTDVYSYASSKVKYVKVSETGLVTAVKAGTAYITISTYNGKSFRLKVTALKAPTSVTAVPQTYELGVGDQFTMGYTLPKKTGGTATFESSDETVLTVDPISGVVTAVGAGQAQVIVRTYNNRTDTCKVTVYGAPTSITLNSNLIDVASGETFELVATLPNGSRSNVTYESADPTVATVSQSGVVTGVGFGTTTIYARTSDPNVFATATVTSWDAPSSIKLNETALTKNVDETYTIKPTIPENSHTTFTYTSSNPKVATVTEEGVVVTLSKGTTVITVETHNGLKAAQNLTVEDPWYPESIKLADEPSMLKIGETYLVKYTVKPETAKPGLVWSSSDETVATVDEAGLVKAVGTGYATITAISQRNEKLTLEVAISVEMDGTLVTTIPERTTSESGIDANLAKIDAIRKCAISQIDLLASKGTIGSSDASARRTIVNNIFKNYAFPWKTLKYQDYWKEANSEGGVKDFKTDRVYFGLPYISGSGNNRHYDVDLALKENRYYDSGEGYYILNQNKLLGGKYVGNDCSGLVNVSIWGTSSNRAADRTDDIASSKYYTTISDWKSMRPGDLICKSSAHVVMFLYYVNSDKTQFMMIENGGAEPGTNTVHCDIYEASYYQSRSYKIRRLASLS